MTANIAQFLAAGAERMYIAKNNSAGYPAGIAGTLANGSDSSLRRVLGFQQSNVQVGEARRVNVEGDDGVQGIFTFAPQELPNGDYQFGVFDATVNTAATGTKIYTIGHWDIPVLQPDDPEFPQFTILMTAQAKSRASGSDGEAGYYNVILPKGELFPRAPAFQNATAHTFPLGLVANRSAKYPWGEVMSNTNQGTTAAPFIGPFWTENPLLMHTHISDGSDLTFTLAETPAAANVNKVAVWRNGVKLAYTTDYTVNTATKVVTLVAAGTAGDVVVVMYEWSKAA